MKFLSHPQASEENKPAKKIRAEKKYDYCIIRKKHEKTNIPQTNLVRALEADVPNARIWVDSLIDADVEEGIRNSTNIILFLSTDFTKNEVVLSQMRFAKQMEKHIIRIQETFKHYHAPNFARLLDECPEDLKPSLGSEESCIDWFAGGPRLTVANIVNASAKLTGTMAGGANEGFLFRGNGEVIQVIDESLLTFAALWGMPLPGAGTRAQRWAFAVRFILCVCLVLCMSRLSIAEGPAFLDHFMIIEIVVDHFALVIFLISALRQLDSDEVASTVSLIDSAPMVRFLKWKTKIATMLAGLLTCSLVLWGWVGYLPGFFHQYYMTHSDISKILFGFGHGMTWVLILPIFFGSLFASLLSMFVVQELSYCAVFSSFSTLHADIDEYGLHAVASAGSELRISRDDFAKFQETYRSALELNRQIQRRGAVPFMIFWVVEFCLMAWSIWSLAQGFSSEHDDERVARLQDHWHLRVRHTFFIGSSLWFGAGALIVGFVPFGTNFYGIRLVQLCRQLKLDDSQLHEEMLTFVKAHDMNLRAWLMRTSLPALPVCLLIVCVNIVGFNADSARLWGAYR